MSHINDLLKVKYGTNLRGQQLFRIVLAERQTEKRFGVYQEHCGSLFLREVRGLRETKKYSYIPPGIMVMERWLPPEVCYTPEVPSTSEGSYEPIFSFQNDKGEPVEVVEEVVLRIAYNLLHPPLEGHQRSELMSQEQIEFDKEVQQTSDELEEAGRSWIGHRLHSKEAIIKL